MHVILLSEDAKHLNTIKKAEARQLDGDALKKVALCLAADIAPFLDSLPPLPIEAQGVHGYKVRVTRKTASVAEAETRRRAVAHVLTRSARRLKNKGKPDE